LILGGQQKDAITSRLQQAKEELLGGIFSQNSFPCGIARWRRRGRREHEQKGAEGACFVIAKASRERTAKWRESAKVEPVRTLCSATISRYC
jgi:hypothetical protein